MSPHFLLRYCKEWVFIITFCRGYWTWCLRSTGALCSSRRVCSVIAVVVQAFFLLWCSFLLPTKAPEVGEEVSGHVPVLGKGWPWLFWPCVLWVTLLSSIQGVGALLGAGIGRLLGSSAHNDNWIPLLERFLGGFPPPEELKRSLCWRVYEGTPKLNIQQASCSSLEHQEQNGWMRLAHCVKNIFFLCDA